MKRIWNLSRDGQSIRSPFAIKIKRITSSDLIALAALLKMRPTRNNCSISHDTIRLSRYRTCCLVTGTCRQLGTSDWLDSACYWLLNRHNKMLVINHAVFDFIDVAQLFLELSNAERRVGVGRHSENSAHSAPMIGRLAAHWRSGWITCIGVHRCEISAATAPESVGVEAVHEIVNDLVVVANCGYKLRIVRQNYLKFREFNSLKHPGIPLPPFG